MLLPKAAALEFYTAAAGTWLVPANLTHGTLLIIKKNRFSKKKIKKTHLSRTKNSNND
jgi:hypothetical protein